MITKQLLKSTSCSHSHHTNGIIKTAVRIPIASLYNRYFFFQFQTANDPYAFIEFQEHVHAVQALTAMNKRILMGKVRNLLFFALGGGIQGTYVSTRLLGREGALRRSFD